MVFVSATRKSIVSANTVMMRPLVELIHASNWMSEHYYEGGSIQLIALEAKILTGEIRLTVHDEVAWVHFDELLSFELPPADIPIAKAVIDSLSNKFLG